MGEQSTITELRSQEEVEAALLRIITESLDLDAGDITSTSKLMGDLDADSLDVLDINFRVNREFNVSLPIAELRGRFEEAETPWIDEHGRITPDGIAAIRDLVPEVTGRVDAGDVLEEVFAVLTIGDLVSMLARRLAIKA